jgi:hypothetical protein
MRKIIASIIAASFTTLACSGADAPEPGSETTSVEQALAGCYSTPCECCEWLYDRCLMDRDNYECDRGNCHEVRERCLNTCADAEY